MLVHFGNRKRIQFSDKTHPFMGILSVAFGIAGVLLMLLLFYFSYGAKGNSGIIVGWFGILDLIICVAGFMMSTKCYKLEDIYMTTPTIGSVLNGVLILFLLILYVIGTV